MFQVFDNGKPADGIGYPRLKDAAITSKFDTLEEAEAYVSEWLGLGWIPLPSLPYDYTGNGDMIEIREVE